MKFNMILGKKQIILASLVLVLGVAIYLNYTFSEGVPGYDITTSTSVEDERTYGEAKLTDVKPDEYFASARVERKKARDESVETLATTLSSPDLTEDEKEIAASKALEVSGYIESENKIETLVKAKGFEECLAFVDKEKVKVIVKTEGLTPEQATQIKNIIVEETDMPSDSIVIDEIK